MSHAVTTLFVDRQPISGVDLIDPDAPFEVVQHRSASAATQLKDSLRKALRRFNARARRQGQRHKVR